ncbi:MAG TPA: copper resistance protein NlpE [Povalibacter sp.]
MARSSPPYLVLIATMTLAACATPKPSGTASAQPVVETWGGVLPCADCIGIRTQLLLYKEQPSGKQIRYEMTETYMGAPGGERSVQTQGRWTISRGSATDRDAIVYQLDFDKPVTTRSFVLASYHELRLLDREQKEIDTPVSHSLHLVSGGQHH